MRKQLAFLVFLTFAVSLASSVHGQVSQAPITAYKINNVVYVDTVKYKTVSACVAAVTDPGICLIPSNVPSGGLWNTPPNYALIVDTRFKNDLGLGEGGLPYQHSHLYYAFHAGANDSYELNAFSGPVGISIQAFADAGGFAGQPSKANVVALYAGAQQNSGSNRPVWAANFVTSWTNNSNQQQTVETDCGNNGASDDPSGVGACERLISGGRKKIGAALVINNTTGAGGANSFITGIRLSNFSEIGLFIGNSTLGRTSDIYIVPPANDTTCSITLRNATNSATTFCLTSLGNVSAMGGIQSSYWNANLAGPAASGQIRVTNAASSICARNSAGTADHCFGEIQHVRVAGCTTSGGSTAFTGPCSTTVTWPSAFANSDYTTQCIGEGIAAGVPLLQGILAGRSASTLTVQTQQATGVNAGFMAIDCTAIHD